jgi:hypothetical protein
MHYHQIRFRLDGEFNCGKARIHGRSNAADRAAISHLQSIGRVVVIADFICPENSVTVSDYCREQNL